MFGRLSVTGAVSFDGLVCTSPAIPHNGSSAADNNNSFFIGKREVSG